MNDFSARAMQWREMKFKLGPAKGKDFATSISPTYAPLETLTAFEQPSAKGSRWDLGMRAYLNDVLICEASFASMHFTFAQIIARCSYGVMLQPGEIIGSGTVGGGCLREYNYAQRLKNQSHQDQWLKNQDVIRLEVDGLGVLENTIVLA